MLPARAKSRNPGVKRTKVANRLKGGPVYGKGVEDAFGTSRDKVT
jgi:hypothetical protein